MPYPIRTMEETNTFAKLLQNAVNCCSATGIFSTASACLFSAPLRHGFCTTSEAHYCFYFALLHAKNSIGLQHLRCQIEKDILVTNNKKKKKSPSYGDKFDWRERQPEDGDGVQWLAFLSWHHVLPSIQNHLIPKTKRCKITFLNKHMASSEYWKVTWDLLKTTNYDGVSLPIQAFIHAAFFSWVFGKSTVACSCFITRERLHIHINIYKT